jgi:hypothetical protein
MVRQTQGKREKNDTAIKRERERDCEETKGNKRAVTCRHMSTGQHTLHKQPPAHLCAVLTCTPQHTTVEGP